MKKKPWLRYVVYLIQLVALVYMDGYAARLNDIYKGQTYGFSFSLIVLGIAIKVSIGLVLGLEHLTNEMKKVGTWRINLPKIVVLVIPSLFFSVSLWVGFVPSEILQTIFTKSVFQLFGNNIGFIPIFQILFGFFLITSFYKVSDPEIVSRSELN